MKSAPFAASQGQTITAALFGRGTEGEPLTIELRAADQ
jgi:hypothetical protein